MPLSIGGGGLSTGAQLDSIRTIFSLLLTIVSSYSQYLTPRVRLQPQPC